MQEPSERQSHRTRHTIEASAVPESSDIEALRRSLFTLLMSVTAPIGLAWGIAYFALGAVGSGVIPFGYGLVTLGCLAYYLTTHRYGGILTLQVALLLLLPFLLQWTLGGFAQSSNVMFWALLAPTSALVFFGPQRALRWFASFLLLTMLSGILEPTLSTLAPSVPLAVRVSMQVMNIGTVAAVIFFILRYFVWGQQAAHERAERLLLNVLPRSIAERLKQEPGIIADRLDEVTVLFADMVGSVPLAADANPRDVVNMLNEIFSEFDWLVEQYQLEKIRTVGDAYMVAGGAPAPRPDHAEAVAGLALDMLEVVKAYRTWNGEPIRLRIGIHTGPVVAGVIGQQKFHYDLYGDTVNTASRLESHGVPGAIQVSDETYRRLDNRYEFETRGSIDIKGKGPMTTYFLRGRRTQAVGSDR